MTDKPQTFRLVGVDDRPWASARDRDAYAMDCLIMGRGYAKQREDGKFVHVPVEDVELP